jgi:iron complex outermembrane receptor protein
MKILKTFLLAFFLLPAIVCAQYEFNKDTITYTLPTEIIVRAPRLDLPLIKIPSPISIVGSNILNNLQRYVAIDEPLKLVPGVKVDNQADGERLHLSIRGQGILTERGTRGIKALFDGLPLNDPSGFVSDFYDVDFNRVEKIEVLRGPSASLFGGSSNGGIINIISKTSPNLPLFGGGFASFGSNNFWKGFGEFGGNTRNVNYLVSFSRTMGDGWRDHTHFWGNNIYAKATYYPVSGVQITPIMGWSDLYHENPEGINLATYNTNPKLSNPDAIPFNEFIENNRKTLGLLGKFVFDNNNELNVSGSIKNTYFVEANNRTFNHRTISTPGTSIQYTNTSAFSKTVTNKFSLGADLQWQTIYQHKNPNNYSIQDLSTLLSNEKITQSGYGVFLIDQISLTKELGLMVSLRYDNMNNSLLNLMDTTAVKQTADFNRATGKFGITYDFMPELNVFASFGTGFIPPSTEELTQNPLSYTGFNKDLTFATSTGFDLGFRGSYKDIFTYDVTGFYLKTQNDFDRYRIAAPRNQETFYKNTGASNRIGIELYGKYCPVKNLIIQAAYTFSSFKYDISTPVRVIMDDTTIVKYIENGNKLPNCPDHQLYVDVEWDFYPGFFVAVNTETLSKYFIDGANLDVEAVKAYTLLGARLGYNFNFCGINGQFSLIGRNLTNQIYVAFSEPDAGGNAYQPGAKNEFFGNLKIRF